MMVILDRRRASGVAIAIAINLISSAVQAQPTPEQLRCIRHMDGAAVRMTQVAWSHQLACLGSRAIAEAGGSVEACLARDPKGKLVKTRSTISARAAVKCANPPELFAANPATTTVAAADSAEATLRGVFGRSLDRPGYVAGSSNAGRCQRAVARALRTCALTMWKSFRGCKESALQGVYEAPPQTSLDLQNRCLGAGVAGIPDADGRIARFCDPASGKLGRAIERECAARGLDLAGVFRGSVETDGIPSGAVELGTRMRRLVACEVCRAVNEANGLDRDCDELDDGSANGTCGAPRPATLRIGVETSQLVYEPGSTAIATVSLSTQLAVSAATMTVRVRKAVRPEAPTEVVQEQTLPVSLAAGTSTEMAIPLGVLPEDSYVVAVELPTTYVFGAAQAKFGVRPLSQNLPEAILHADIYPYDVPSLAAQLEAGATNDSPITLGLGPETVVVQVDHAHPFAALDPGESVPSSFANARFYRGSVCAADSPPGGCNAVAGSGAVFVVTDDIPEVLFAWVAARPEDALWIAPWRVYSSGAGLSQHVSYRTHDVGAVALEEGDLAVAASRMRQGRNNPSACPNGATVNKTLRLRIFEQPIADPATDFEEFAMRSLHRGLIAEVAIIGIKNEFVEVVPRLHWSLLTVQNVLIAGWTIKSVDGYPGNCAAVVNAFAADHPNDRKTNHVYFTTNGLDSEGEDDCLGIGHLGQDSASQHSIVRDVRGDARAVITFMHELGHNWDWHSTWTPPSHDSHVSPEISERWTGPNGDDYCTLMHSGYDSDGNSGTDGVCKSPIGLYSRESTRVLHHLAEGMCHLDVPPPTPTPTITPTKPRTPTRTRTPGPYDLTIQSIDELRLVSGVCRVYYTIANLGTAYVNSTTTYVSATAGSATDFHHLVDLALPPGVSRQEYSDLFGVPCDGLTIVVTADVDQRINELDETNNSRSRLCTLGSCGLLPCGSSSAPLCDGACPSGQVCAMDIDSLDCFCYALPVPTPTPSLCGDTYPACNGTCPPGEFCTNFGGGINYCTCYAIP